MENWFAPSARHYTQRSTREPLVRELHTVYTVPFAILDQLIAHLTSMQN